MTLICTAALALGGGCAAPVSTTNRAPASAPSAPETVAPTADPATPATLTRPPQPRAPRPSGIPGTARPVVDGWQLVHSGQRAALYDVPPDWTVATEDTIVGFETKGGQVLVAGSGSASIGRNACGPATTLATSVVKHSTSDDLATASRLEAEQWATAAFLDSGDRRPTLRTGKPETTTTATGKRAVIVRVATTAASPIGNCGPKGATYAVAATGFSGRLGPTVILVVVTSTGFASAVPDGRIRQVLTTLRPDA